LKEPEYSGTVNEKELDDFLDIVFAPRTDYPYKFWIGKDNENFRAGTYTVKSKTEIEYNPKLEF